MKRMSITICICLLSVLGCDKKSDMLININPHANEIWPLATGNYWTYSSNNYDSTGAITSSKNNNSFFIVGDTIINSTKWYMFLLPIFLITNLDGGVYGYYSSGPKLILKYPASVQDSFPLIGSQVYVHVKSVNSRITLSSGTFCCYAYEIKSPPTSTTIGGSVEIDYYCPGVGMVKVESYSSTATNKNLYLSMVSELVSYSLKE
jgi:hypothetical protein